MGVRIKPIIGAALTGAVIAYLGTQFIFNPAMPEPAFEPMLPIVASLAVFWIVMSLFFDWAVQKTGKTMLTAMVIALSQILLVDFNYVLLGRRELQPALYSVGILLVVWAAVAVVYDKLSETS
jgi:tryptophan-rich sensory protein